MGGVAGRSPWQAPLTGGSLRRATRLASPTVGEVADGSPGEGEQRVAGDGQLAWRAKPRVKPAAARPGKHH